MAKGNLFLGTAARSVGDVVMYRREGSQVSRVRVRKIANPKTDAQCKQRAYMAPIPKFFSPLAIVLERSFEGLSKSKSYSKFLKVNADKARANDWLLPKGTAFFPLPYTLSQGTIPEVVTYYDSDLDAMAIDIDHSGETFTTVGDISKSFVASGYQNGDIVTIIGIQGDAPELKFVPHTLQFEIDTTSSVLLTAISSRLLKVTGDAGNGWRFGNNDGDIRCGAVIVARFENDKWRRSTAELFVVESVMNAISSADYKAAAIASYSNTVNEGNPMVYLDGEELA